MASRCEQLPEGPLDIIGDVHGEIDALRDLLAHLGVDVERRRAERPVVFVGDLVDRGPDSVAVVDLFRRLADAGLAQGVLGNHELNLLLDDRKPGNRWFWGIQEAGYASRAASGEEQARVRAAIARLPLALERRDLRVVHAMWDPAAFGALPPHGEWAAISRQIEERQRALLASSTFLARLAEERSRYPDLRDAQVVPVFLDAHADEDLTLQDNAVKLLTSGGERKLQDAPPFFRERWRFVERRRWWREQERVDRPTVVGHYWRSTHQTASDHPEPWDDVGPFEWANGVFCVDYSVGRRFQERKTRAVELAAGRPFRGRLGALRWPERTLVFDDGEQVETTGRAV